MPRVLNRQKLVPGGYRFRQPEINFETTHGLGFSAAVAEVIRARLANPFQAKLHKWKLDEEGVSEEVDTYNAQRCIDQGWLKYVREGSLNPKPLLPPHIARSRAAQLVVGAKTIGSWAGEGAKPVSRELAWSRANVCLDCPLNDKESGLLEYFTVKVADVIRKQIGMKNDLSLTLPEEDRLGVCSRQKNDSSDLPNGCGCSLKLKVWTPLSTILKGEKLNPRQIYHPACWVISESEKK